MLGYCFIPCGAPLCVVVVRVIVNGKNHRLENNGGAAGPAQKAEPVIETQKDRRHKKVTDAVYGYLPVAGLHPPSPLQQIVNRYRRVPVFSPEDVLVTQLLQPQ